MKKVKKTGLKDKARVTNAKVYGSLKSTMQKAIKWLSLAILAGFAYEGVMQFWNASPNIAGFLSLLVVGLLVYSHIR